MLGPEILLAAVRIQVSSYCFLEILRAPRSRQSTSGKPLPSPWVQACRYPLFLSNSRKSSGRREILREYLELGFPHSHALPSLPRSNIRRRFGVIT